MSMLMCATVNPCCSGHFGNGHDNGALRATDQPTLSMEKMCPRLSLLRWHHITLITHKRALSVCSSGPTVACWSNHWLWVTLNKLFHFCEPWLSSMKNMTTTNLVRLMAGAALNNYPQSSDLRCHPSQQALFLKQQQQQKTVTLCCPDWPWTQPFCMFSEWWDIGIYHHLNDASFCMFAWFHVDVW